MNADDNVTSLKIVFIGDASVGKTSLINRYFEASFSEKFGPTISVGFYTQEFQLDGHNFKIFVYDTAGQEIYKSITKLYYRNAAAAIGVFDLGNEDTFLDVRYWILEFHNIVPDALIYIAGNKMDKAYTNETHGIVKKALKFAEKKKIKLFLTSAKTGECVAEMFETAINEICMKHIDSTNQALILNSETRSKCC